MKKYQVLARRYRPKIFKDVVGQEAIVTTLKNAIRFDKVAHAYLFCGSRGVGKTTLARLFAKALNCSQRGADCEPCGECPSCQEINSGQSLDVIEIDGASNRGIDDIRQINETVGYAPSSGQYKIYIIDEVHMLTKEAFNALLKTLEEPPEKAKFFFATTEPHKVLPTILSRCQRFDLNRISLPQITSKLEQIGQDLEKSIDPEALHLIASHADGSLRDAESLLDQLLCFSEGAVTGDVVRQTLGLLSQDHFFAIDQAFSEARAAYAFELVEYLFQNGKDFAHFFEQWIEHIRLLSIIKMVGEKGTSLPSDLSSRYIQSARLYTQAQLLYLLDYSLQAEVQFHRSLVPRVFLEATLLHAIRSKNRVPLEVLVRRLSELEHSLTIQTPKSIEAPPIPPEPESSPPEEPELPPPPSALKPVPFSPYTKASAPAKAPVSKSTEVSPIPPKPESSPPEEPEFLPLPSVLKPVPLSSYTKASIPAEPVKKREEPTAKAPTLVAERVEKPSVAFDPPSGGEKHPSHYDTLIRFAAIELEGNVTN